MNPKRPNDIEFQRMKAHLKENPPTPAPIAIGGGLGDRVHAILGPLGKFIHWPCLKGDGTTDLKPKSLCNYFRITLNKI